MSQSSYIAAFLIIGFIVFITMRGELSKYLDVFGLSNSGATTGSTTGTSSTSNLPSLPSLPKYMPGAN